DILRRAQIRGRNPRAAKRLPVVRARLHGVRDQLLECGPLVRRELRVRPVLCALHFVEIRQNGAFVLARPHRKHDVTNRKRDGIHSRLPASCAPAVAEVSEENCSRKSNSKCASPLTLASITAVMIGTFVSIVREYQPSGACSEPATRRQRSAGGNFIVRSASPQRAVRQLSDKATSQPGPKCQNHSASCRAWHANSSMTVSA